MVSRQVGFSSSGGDDDDDDLIFDVHYNIRDDASMIMKGSVK